MVFITGGTGFIGKVLVEKLLRVFSIKRIYLLVRVKDNMAVDERLEHFFQESVRKNKIEKNYEKRFKYSKIANVFFYMFKIHSKVCSFPCLFSIFLVSYRFLTDYEKSHPT